MARTITEVHSELKANFEANTDVQTVYGLNPAQSFDQKFSRVSIENLFLYVVAVSISVLDNLFSTHKTDVSNLLATLKPHSLQWYQQKAKAFQYGQPLIEDTDLYLTDVESSRIVSNAAVDEINGALFMKVAKDVEGDLSPLVADELTAFTQYIARIKDAGVKINIISVVGDDLRLVMDIYYDPLVLNADGTLISDPSLKPAEDTIKAFIKTLKFNGEFIPVSLVDAVQLAAGIDIPEVLSVETKYAANDWEVVKGKVVPNAGYLTIAPENLTLNYIANVQR